METDTTTPDDDRDLRLLLVAALGVIAILTIAAAIISARRTQEPDVEPGEVATIAIEPEAEAVDQFAEEAATRS